MQLNKHLLVSTLAAATLGLGACSDTGDDDPGFNTNIELKAQSVTPSLAMAMPGFENKIEFYPLVSSEDVLPGSPSFVFGPQPDGAGLMKDPASDGYILLNNHEITRSVSRVFLDKTLKPTKGEYIVDATGGMTRLCSATLVDPQEHGFGPVFLTAGESGEESLVHAISPTAFVSDRKRQDRVLPALGKASMENAVPLPKEAYPGKTVILIGEDQSYSTTHISAGQLIVYISNTGDLSNGKYYVLKRTNGDQVEMNMTKGSQYDVELVEIPGVAGMTGAQINLASNAAGAIRFSRVEDVDYRKGGGDKAREIYFVATGQASSNQPVAGYTMWGRMYKLMLAAGDPTKGAKLSVAAEGDSNPGNDLINPDNVCVTENYVYIQEDGDSYYAAAKHDSYVWQYNIGSGAYKPYINMNHKRTDAAWNARFNQSGEMRFGSWEYGAMWDVSKIIGVPGTFMLNIHPHTWRNDKFKDADGSNETGTRDNNEGGQTILLRGVDY
jgi:hypothetical protein